MSRVAAPVVEENDGMYGDSYTGRLNSSGRAPASMFTL
jgi:hypothetical protein